LGAAATAYDVKGIATNLTSYIIGAKVDSVIHFTTGSTGTGINWETVGSLLEICADKDTFGDNIESMGWGDPPGANDACLDFEFSVDTSLGAAIGER